MDLMNKPIAGWLDQLSFETVKDYLGRFPSLDYAIVDSLQDYQLMDYQTLTSLPDDCQEIWAFNDSVQLHFIFETENASGAYWRLVIIGNEEEIFSRVDELEEVLELDPYYEVEERQVLLWGDQKKPGGAWYEMLVPRIFHYPYHGLDDARRLGLDIRVFSQGGRVIFVQYLRLSKWEGA